jgi:hypothetical protein
MSRLRLFVLCLFASMSASIANACPQAAATVVTEAVPVAAPVVAVQSFAVPSVAVLATPAVVTPIVTTSNVVVEEVVHQRHAPRTQRVRVRVISR